MEPESLPWAILERHCALWSLTADGPLRVTSTSLLQPVRRDGRALMLKIARVAEERRGARLMGWWDGRGAAPVLAIEGDALLMQRAAGGRDLVAMARRGADEAATAVIVAVVRRLHRHPSPPTFLTPLPSWFADLESVADGAPPWMRRAAAMARTLLAAPVPEVALHGDVHHANILDFGERGWLAIDPKGLVGDRAFDYVNLFRNPDIDQSWPAIATRPAHFARRVAQVSRGASLEPAHLLRWIVAGMGLFAAWALIQGNDAALERRIAGLALGELEG